MDITIIGAGNMGRGIATCLLGGGHSVTLIDTDESQAAELALQLQSQSKNGAKVSAAAAGSPIDSEVVILAVYYPAVASVLEKYGEELAGKVLVDITNPVNATFDDLVLPPTTSAAEEIAKQAADSKVVKAFNTTFAGTLEAGQVDGQPLDILIAGDDISAKALLSDLVRSGGLRPVDVGPLRRARQLEGLGLLHITLQQTLGSSWMSTIRFLH